MRIAEFSVRNVPFMAVMFVLMIAIGVTAWRDMPRTEDPHFPITAFSIVAIYPGADPIEIERQIVEPIEEAVLAIAGCASIAVPPLARPAACHASACSGVSMPSAMPTTPATGLCSGCYRTVEEIAGWGQAGEAQRLAIWERIESRQVPRAIT